MRPCRHPHRHWMILLVLLPALMLCPSCSPSIYQSASILPFVDPPADVDLAGPLCVDRVASEIDKFEKLLEKYGSIVPKHADVWGQARLMMHRQEFEREMKKDLPAFSPTFQASIFASDQAYLANAFSLQAGLSPGGATGGDPSVLVSDPKDVISRDKLMVQRASLTNLVGPGGKLSLEPTIIEDQKKRFLDHLHELRRINEGDDNTDAPGYALNLVRIPISVLAGECTQTGYGAECAITATPHLPDDLLPTTFRTLVINDIVDVLTLAMTKWVEEKDTDLKTNWAVYDDLYHRAIDPQPVPEKVLPSSPPQPNGSQTLAPVRQPEPRAPNRLSTYSLNRLSQSRAAPQRVREMSNRARKRTPKKAQQLNSGASPAQSLRAGKQRPLSPSQVEEVFLRKNLYEIALALQGQIKDHLACPDKAYHLDVQAALREELTAAYTLLSSDEYQCLWEFATPALVEAIHTRDGTTFGAMGNRFRAILDAKDKQHDAGTGAATPTGSNGPKNSADAKDQKNDGPPLSAITRALAWCIVVDSALLTARFLDDMKSTQAGKGCTCAPPGWVPLYLPHPPEDVCRLFNDYVRCRWPLHVFALDPVTEDQNVADSFSLRREMQLALSLGFTSGQISARNFTRYVRRIEKDIDTIAINRTIIGFSHGDDTFGWRFYPRVQTPPIDGNFEAIFRDLLLGGYGPKHDLRRRRLENGIRECVALVIMPSFVPYVDLEVTGNWFKLADPKCKELNLKQVMRLSKRVKAIQEWAPGCADNDCYRPGDVNLMMHRLEQLSKRLPLQQQLVSVPYENTHGGFELLSTGVTDLGPELLGWYGAPGINPNGETSLFLVGDNFSVHQTRVIVGGKLLDPSCQVACPGDGDPLECKCPDKKQPAEQADATPSPMPVMPPVDGNVRYAVPPDALPGSGADVQPADYRQSRKYRRSGTPAATVNVLTVPRAATAPSATAQAADAKATAADAMATVADAKATLADAHANMAGGGAPANPGNSPGNGAAPATAKQMAADAKTTAAQAKLTAADAKATAADAKANGTASNGMPGPSVELPVYRVELLSRQVMRVIIPKGVYWKDGVVDVHIATPYGVSQHLEIPVLCPPEKDASAKSPPATGYTVRPESSKLTVPYAWRPKGLGDWPVLAGMLGGSFVLDWNEATGSAASQIDVVFTFAADGMKDPVRVPLYGIFAREGYFQIDGPRATELAQRLLDALASRVTAGKQDFTRQTPPPTTFVSAEIAIRPRPLLEPPTHAVKTVTASGKVTIELKPLP